MPNWCYNSLRVSGPAGEVKKFREAVTKGEGEYGPEGRGKGAAEFTMEGLWPTPPALLNESSPSVYRGDAEDLKAKAEWEQHRDSLLKQYGATDWYDWRVSKWGTKWDAADSDFSSDDEDVLTISYSTAWSPNRGFIKRAAELFSELHFTLLYEEPGMGFCGVLVCQDGEVLADMEEDLQWMDPDMGDIVEWDSEIDRWKVAETGEVIDNEDFNPVEYNPFSEEY